MSVDLSMSVVVSRSWLALAPLDINDGVIYRCAPQFLGATVSWTRQSATSPYIDGSVTVSRTRGLVQEQIAVEVAGRTATSATLSNALLKANMDALVDAFCQDSFTLDVTVGGALYSYAAEASDYQMTWVGTRFMAKRGQVVLTVPRQPVALVGTL